MHVLLVLSALVVSLFPLSGYPQNAPLRLDEVVVTASRIETPLGEAPANVTVITADDIQSTGAQTLIDVFRREPGVFVQNQLGNPKASNIDVRGYGEAAPQNVLVLINGRRINSIDLSGADLAQLPVSDIERVEVYRGPASVLFGDNAAAGAIISFSRREKVPRKRRSPQLRGATVYSNRSFPCPARRAASPIWPSARPSTRPGTGTITAFTKRTLSATLPTMYCRTSR